MGRVALIVLDGLGIGEAPDTDDYGDAGSNTLGNVARVAGPLALPNLERLGLGRCAAVRGLRADTAEAATGVAVPRSPGKDSTTGHWEICGVILERPFPTYPDGFPAAIVSAFSAATGRGVLGNRAASGTAILEELGRRHVETGSWIVYTSADSVFQIAAHEDVVSPVELDAGARAARRILSGDHAVSRVITRPFRGGAGRYQRTENRRDYSVDPVAPTLLDRLAERGIPRVGVGKVDDLFAGRGIESEHTARNRDAYRLIRERWDGMSEGLLFANVIEFDQSWGHRNDVAGFVGGLHELDLALPGLLRLVGPGDLMILTADHGNDPTTSSTDHSREIVPLLVYGPRVEAVSLGRRDTFADIGATVAEFFGVEYKEGTSFLSEVWR